MKKYILLLVTLFSLQQLQGQVGLPETPPQVQLVSGCNTSEAYFCYAKDMVTTPKLPFLPNLRIMGGTFSKDFKFHADYSFFTPNITARNLTYAKYKGWNYRNNHTWVLIKTITEDLTRDANCTFVLPTLNHYSTSALKTELYNNYLQLSGIKTFADLQKSPMSPAFKATVTDALDLFRALINNRVKIQNVELGNELYLNHSSNFGEKIWIYNKDKSDQWLTAYGELCKMYTWLLREIQPGLLFFFPLAEEIDGGHKIWNRYFLNSTFDGFAFHPYAKPVTSIDPKTAFSQVLTGRNNIYAYFKNVVVPLIPGKLIMFSEWSSSEYNKCLQGTDYDRLLYLNEIKHMIEIPQIISNHYHAFTNGVAPSCAIKMNGYTKQGGAVINAVGKGLLEVIKN